MASRNSFLVFSRSARKPHARPGVMDSDEGETLAVPAFIPVSDVDEQEARVIEHLAEEIVASVPDFSFLFRSQGTLKELLIRTIKELPPTRLRASLLQNIQQHVIAVENK